MEATFPQILVKLRKERRLSQRDAADALGVSQALLSHYENGIREPKLDFVCKAAEYYSCSTDFLLGQTQERRGGRADAQQESSELAERLADAAAALPSLIEYLVRDGDPKLAQTSAEMLGIAVYRSFRALWCGEKAEGLFSTEYSQAMSVTDIMAKSDELRALRRAASSKKSLPDAGLLASEFPDLWDMLSEIISGIDAKVAARLRQDSEK